MQSVTRSKRTVLHRVTDNMRSLVIIIINMASMRVTQNTAVHIAIIYDKHECDTLLNSKD